MVFVKVGNSYINANQIQKIVVSEVKPKSSNTTSSEQTSYVVVLHLVDGAQHAIATFNSLQAAHAYIHNKLNFVAIAKL